MSSRILSASLTACFVLFGCGGGAQPPRTEQDTMQPRAERIAVPLADSLPLVSIRDVVDGRVRIGARVRVRGSCIGYSRVLAAGPQPRTRSDWQVVTDSTAVWVVGPYPAGCEPTTAAAEPVTFAVEVAEDTLEALGVRPAQPRRYLLYLSQP